MSVYEKEGGREEKGNTAWIRNSFNPVWLMDLLLKIAGAAHGQGLIHS